MERLAKNTLRMTAAFATAIVLCLAAVAAYFIYPGTPGNSKCMKFEGYIDLPRDRSLNILDYMTIDEVHYLLQASHPARYSRLT